MLNNWLYEKKKEDRIKFVFVVKRPMKKRETGGGLCSDACSEVKQYGERF